MPGEYFKEATKVVVDRYGLVAQALDATAEDVGADHLHGIESAGALSFDNSSHVLTIATGVTYWFKGVQRVNPAATTCDLDEFVTLTARVLYYVAFDDISGILKASASPWTLDDYVPVATVFWNGTAGAVCDERHGHRRNREFHKWAHLTVGARISAADFAMTAPSSGSPSTIDFAGGTLYDEDKANVFTRNSPAGMLLNCRVWYQVASGSFTFEDRNTAYPSVGAAFVDSDATPNYTLTAISGGQHANVWLYVAPDTERPIYAVLETRTAAHATAASARAVTPPNLSSFGLTPELKLLYRVIFNASEAFVESTDYRSSASLPAGGTTAPSAASVTFAPAGNIAATSVQAAIEELDGEKAATSDVTGKLDKSGGTMTGAITLDDAATAITMVDDAGIKYKADPADGKYNGIVVGGTAGYTVAFGDLVYLDPTDSRWEKADISAAAAADGDARAVLGICVSSSGGDGDAINVLLHGIVQAASAFPTLTVGAPAYASTTGDVVVAQPTTTDYVIRIVGYGLTGDILFFNPDSAWITHT